MSSPPVLVFSNRFAADMICWFQKFSATWNFLLFEPRLWKKLSYFWKINLWGSKSWIHSLLRFQNFMRKVTISTGYQNSTASCLVCVQVSSYICTVFMARKFKISSRNTIVISSSVTALSAQPRRARNFFQRILIFVKIKTKKCQRRSKILI